MPDFAAMSDAQLRQFKSQRARDIQAARAEMREANGYLEVLRAKAEEKWVRAVQAASSAGRTGDEHSAEAARLFALPDAEFDSLVAALPARGSREERRASARGQSTTVVAPAAGAAGRARPARVEA